MALDFGILYELTVRPPGDRLAARSIFQALVDQIRVADRVGFHSVWNVEHHFLPELSQSSNNDVLLGAYAAATENIRLGYGVKLLPFSYNHPVRSAEAVATLDQISGGRVEFGTGRSFTEEDLGGFGIDPDELAASGTRAWTCIAGSASTATRSVVARIRNVRSSMIGRPLSRSYTVRKPMTRLARMPRPPAWSMSGYRLIISRGCGAGSPVPVSPAMITSRRSPPAATARP
jgi:alkanesulfonate monooxygenase SsuD/methylene tetrahydromethanopterin reductase-like flavin-dependent oxidoreductase (luciferase family)